MSVAQSMPNKRMQTDVAYGNVADARRYVHPAYINHNHEEFNL